MSFRCEDVLAVWDAPIYRVSWFVVHTHTLLLASPTARAAVQLCDGDAAWRSGDGDLDFILYDLKTAAGGDKREVVDYGFLAHAPQPPRRPGQTVAERRAELLRWMAAAFTAFSSTHLAENLRSVSPLLAFEYDSVLSAIGAGGPRVVRGMVVPAMDGSGGATVRLVIPLLLQHAEKTFQALSNMAVLYCKFAHHGWRDGYKVVKVEADLHVRLQANSKTGKLAVVSEEVDLRIVDQSKGSAAESLVPFLRSCLHLQSLPRLSVTPQEVGFMDLLPQLDAALYKRVREPLHFMKLVLGLAADFGSPVELSVSCKTLAVTDVPALPSAAASSPSPALLPPSSSASPSSSSSSPVRKTAVFCVVDSATSLSFSVGLHYHSGEELPSVEAICTQYLDPQHEGAWSHKVRYPKTGAAMRRDDDGFLDVEELRTTVVHGVMECMVASVAAAA